MDAAIAGLIGSLGGVIVGAAAQAAQAARSRRWQIADQERTAAEQQETRLWQERRIAYAAFMSAEMDATDKINWAWLINAAGQSLEEGSDNPVREEATEAMRLASEAIRNVARQAQEIALITGSDAVKEAVIAYSAGMALFNPTAAHSGNPHRSEQGQALLAQLTQAANRFVAAAREELHIESNRPAGPSPCRQRVRNDDQR